MPKPTDSCPIDQAMDCAEQQSTAYYAQVVFQINPENMVKSALLCFFNVLLFLCCVAALFSVATTAHRFYFPQGAGSIYNVTNPIQGTLVSCEWEQSSMIVHAKGDYQGGYQGPTKDFRWPSAGGRLSGVVRLTNAPDVVIYIDRQDLDGSQLTRLFAHTSSASEKVLVSIRKRLAYNEVYLHDIARKPSHSEWVEKKTVCCLLGDQWAVGPQCLNQVALFTE